MHIEQNVDMSKYTSFRAGGRARRLIRVDSEQELIDTLKDIKTSGEKYIFLGRGTNTLFADGTYDGAVVMLGESFDYVRKVDDLTSSNDINSNYVKLRVGAAALLSKVAKFALSNELTGFEFAAGIPGSLGGAVFMNAGAYGEEMKGVLESVEVISSNHEIQTVKASDLELGYRRSRLLHTAEIVTSAVIRLTRSDAKEIEDKMLDLAERRRSKQPLEYPSAGSFFKRPANNFAGKLIEDVGLKGLSVGGAEVSTKHSGFIINKGGATATDIMALRDIVRRRVFEKTNIMLDTEVRIIEN